MAYELSAGSAGLRREVVDAMAHQIAEPSYKFMQAVSVLPTNALTHTFYREDPTVSTGPTGNKFKGVPFGSALPQSYDTFQEVSVRVIAHKVETNIAWEYLKGDTINLQARAIVRRTREIVKSIDDDIWTTLTTNGNILTSFSVQTAAHGAWDETSAAIIDDIYHASRLISEKDYPTDNLMCFINPYDKESFLHYLASKGAQFPAIAEDAVRNGVIGKIGKVTFIEANSVTTSQALVVVPKTVATWKEFEPLTTASVMDPLKSWMFRVAQEGILEVTDPYAMCLLRGTRIA